MSKTFTREEVAQKNSEDNAWIIVDTVVYDISKFAAMHPGGEKLLLEYAGKDATGISSFVLNLYQKKSLFMPFIAKRSSRSMPA